MNKKIIVLIGFLPVLFSLNARAENYVGLGLGWTVNAKLKGIEGDENLNYPGPIDTTNGTYYPSSSYSNISLKDVLQGGIKLGHYFEQYPSFGIELETNYSQPNMKQQNVTISNPNANPISGLQIGDAIGAQTDHNNTSPTSVTENQLSAKVKLLQFNLNALYRYREIPNFTPYIGAGPSLNIIRITGTGESGHFIDPTDTQGTQIVAAADAPSVSDTSVNWGINFKVGAEYKLNEEWGVAGEYHYNWSNVDISHFRSANNLKADLELQTFNVVLMRHF